MEERALFVSVRELGSHSDMSIITSLFFLTDAMF